MSALVGFELGYVKMDGKWVAGKRFHSGAVCGKKLEEYLTVLLLAVGIGCNCMWLQMSRETSDVCLATLFGD